MEARQEPRFARLLGWLLVMVPAAALFALVAWILSWRAGVVFGITSATAIVLWFIFVGRHRASWSRRR